MSAIHYETSKDYERLHDLISERRHVVCFVDYEGVCMDVCVARCYPEDDRVMFGARGIEYGMYMHLHEKARFLADCERMKLEFIDIAGHKKASK